MTECSFVGCLKPVRARELCGGHYEQRRRGQALRPLRHRPQCSFPGCIKPHHQHGLCSGHRAQKKKGKTLTPLRESPTRGMGTAQRFWFYVDKTATCWLWTGGKNHQGYGRFRIGKRTFQAHRVAWQILVGPLSDDVLLDHDGPNGCRNPSCVRPEHLIPVTPAEHGVRTLRNGLPTDNKTGFIGVVANKGGFETHVFGIYVGRYKTAKEAGSAYWQARNLLDGELRQSTRKAIIEKWRSDL